MRAFPDLLQLKLLLRVITISHSFFTKHTVQNGSMAWIWKCNNIEFDQPKQLFSGWHQYQSYIAHCPHPYNEGLACDILFNPWTLSDMSGVLWYILEHFLYMCTLKRCPDAKADVFTWRDRLWYENHEVDCNTLNLSNYIGRWWM